MSYTFTAVYQKQGNWYLGWIEEIPGVNTQGKTLKEAKENLKEALELIFKNQKTSQTSSVPRHTEVNDFLARKICTDLGIPSVPYNGTAPRD